MKNENPEKKEKKFSLRKLFGGIAIVASISAVGYGSIWLIKPADGKVSSGTTNAQGDTTKGIIDGKLVLPPVKKDSATLK